MASNRAMLIPSSREGRTNRSEASRWRLGASVAPGSSTASLRPSRATWSPSRGPLRAVAEEGELGRGDGRRGPTARPRPGCRAPSRGRAGRRSRPSAPSSRAGAARARGEPARRWVRDESGRPRSPASSSSLRDRLGDRDDRVGLPAASADRPAEPAPGLPGEVAGGPGPSGRRTTGNPSRCPCSTATYASCLSIET